MFLKNLIGDCLLTDSLRDSHIALIDIDGKKLEYARQLINHLNQRINRGRAVITAHTDRREALPGADFVIVTIQVGGYERVVQDYEIPMRYGLHQTYADTLGIGGIFRGLRTAPIMLGIARDIEELCPNAWLLNYTNPMAILTGALLKSSQVKTVGLCHSVQVCARVLLEELGLQYQDVEYQIAGVNHQAWLLKITSQGKDIYHEIRAAAAAQVNHPDQVRLEILKKFGYYVTESSAHTAEYTPYFIKKAYPNLAEKFGISTEMFREWGGDREKFWTETVRGMIDDDNLSHTRSEEYSSYIMNAMLMNEPYLIHGNVLNHNYIENLPYGSPVEVPCIVNAKGITPQRVGALPLQCAGLNRTYLNVVDLTIEAILTCKKEYVYYAALLDPHTAAEQTADEIICICDEMIQANQDYLSYII